MLRVGVCPGKRKETFYVTVQRCSEKDFVGSCVPLKHNLHVLDLVAPR